MKPVPLKPPGTRCSPCPNATANCAPPTWRPTCKPSTPTPVSPTWCSPAWCSSRTSELGTLYSLAELEELSALCRRYDIPLYLDGARLAYGLATPDADVTLADIARLTDAFYIGGTKCGALCGEAVVFPRGGMPRHFLTHAKQHGALLAKGRLLGVQFDTLFTDDLYGEVGRTAAAAAGELRRILREAGCTFFRESPTNQQFVVLDNAQVEALAERVRFSTWEKLGDGRTVIRLVTSWSTTPDDLAALKAALHDVM